MSWFHHICECGCDIHNVEYTKKGVILTCKNCGYQWFFQMPEWVKEGLCVTCKYKETCKKIQAGIVKNKCEEYKK